MRNDAQFFFSDREPYSAGTFCSTAESVISAFSTFEIGQIFLAFSAISRNVDSSILSIFALTVRLSFVITPFSKTTCVKAAADAMSGL